MKTKTRAFLMYGLILVGFGAASRTAGAETGPQGIRFLPDVAGQFSALTRNPEPLALHNDGSPDPSLCRHYQTMARVESADGTPFLLVTKSGNSPDAVHGIEFACFDGDGENGFGHLVVFRMGSRDKSGERLRSNRLSKLAFIDQTQPPAGDKATIFHTVTENGLVSQNGPSGTIPARIFSHPGSMQVVGHTMALALESPCQNQIFRPAALCEPTTVSTMIQFYDVSDPEHPVLTSSFSPQTEMGDKCGVVGITPLPGGRNLLVAAGGDNDRFFFYRSNAVDLDSRELRWEPIGDIPGPSVGDPHQTLNFLRQGDIHGPLFLAGARGFALSESIVSPGHSDFIDLYRVTCGSEDCPPGTPISLTDELPGKRVDNFPASFGSRLVNLAAASAFYVSPSGELIFYATEHDNDGPGRTVKAGEWRHFDVVRDDSPTLLPHADIQENYEVEEGDKVTLTGRGRPAVTRAFIQLFREKDHRDFCTVVDFDDADLDDFDELNRFCVFQDGEGIRSWSWYAPEGCSIFATDNQLGGSKILKGTGRIERDSDLELVPNDRGTNDMDKRVDNVRFEGGCDAYYDTSATLEWDLNLDGIFETTGDEVTFDSRGLDGPSVVSVPVQARHPQTTLPGTATAKVVVRNLQPVIRDIFVTDGAGNEVPSRVPFVLVGLPVNLRFPFSDAGTPDHQTAQVAWGDGVIDPHTSFLSFKDAFGGVIGEGVARHVYTTPAEYNMVITVADDDGDAERDGTTIKVVTAAQALDDAIVRLDDLIAGTSDPALRTLLQKVAKALYGNPHAVNGAREMLRTGNREAAIAFLNQAIGWLKEASALGANVSTLTAILQQLVLALSAGV